MRILNSLVIKNYKIISRAHLDSLASINILVGPNNTGKSSILDAIEKLTSIGSASNYVCDSCTEFANGKNGVVPFTTNITREERYYNRMESRMNLNATFNDEWLSSFQSFRPLVELIKEQKEALEHNHAILELIEQEGGFLLSHHVSPIPFESISALKSGLLRINPNRLEKYNGKNFSQYAREMKLTDSQKLQMRELLVKLVDQSVIDQEDFDLIREDGDGARGTFSIDIQGSGTKAVYGIVLDVLKRIEPGIILFDEPEVGLNQAAKMNLISLVIELSKKKQFFISTQDSSIINPFLISGTDISIYVYSPKDGGGFTRIDLKAREEHLCTSSGVLPHTTSTRRYHIYVEGASDVFIFRVFLEKYLKKEKPQDRFELINNIDLFSLGGNNWVHILYTIPKPPYKCLVVLDGDKKDEAKASLSEYAKSRIHGADILFCERGLSDITEVVSQKKTPLYCLKDKGIESYLKVNYRQKGYDKTRDGPIAADSMDEIPSEIAEIFDRFFGWGKHVYAAFKEEIRSKERL